MWSSIREGEPSDRIQSNSSMSSSAVHGGKGATIIFETVVMRAQQRNVGEKRTGVDQRKKMVAISSAAVEFRRAADTRETLSRM